MTNVVPMWRGDEARNDGRREFIRRYLPKPTEGFVAEDLDLVVRWFGSSSSVYELDSQGRFMLAELKLSKGKPNIGFSKHYTFRYMDACLRAGDAQLSSEPRYRGFYVISSPSEDWESTTTFQVNNDRLDREQFVQWLRCDEGTWDMVHTYTFPNPARRAA